jgi:predicted nicotinamide N-methyase
MEELTPQQQAEIIANKIINATKINIISRLSPEFDKLISGHVHFTKELADAIIKDIKNS